MPVLRNERLELLEYLKSAVARIRDFADREPGPCGDAMRLLAEQLTKDAENLQAEMLEAGFIPQPTQKT